MEKNLLNLALVLSKELNLYKDLYEISLKKSQAVVDGNLSELTSILSVEQQLIVQLGHLEKERENNIILWARESKLDPTNVTISLISETLSGEIKNTLETLALDLNEIIGRQKVLNDLNENLIKNNLEFIDFSIKLIAGQDEAGVSYSKDGKNSVKPQNRNLFDQKV